MARSARARLRTHVMTQLNEARDHVKLLRSWWTAEGTVYLFPDQRDPAAPHRTTRDRRPDEYPENQRRYWIATATRLAELIQTLDRLRQYCIDQAEEIAP